MAKKLNKSAGASPLSYVDDQSAEEQQRRMVKLGPGKQTTPQHFSIADYNRQGKEHTATIKREGVARNTSTLADYNRGKRNWKGAKDLEKLRKK